ncbi:MAG: ABC transporter permease [Deltaproteobacteria bacterium]|nr:ABC transporter permease [Deltaproteobacteria bacterium]
MRDLKVRYRQMALGPLWIILVPVILMVVFSLVFGGLAKMPSDGLPYPIFTFAALLPWQFFSTGLTRGSSSLVSNIATISKIYFPRMLLPLAAVVASLVDLLASLLVLACMMAAYGIGPGWHNLALPGFILLAAATALALSLWLATLSVAFRDVIIGLPYVLQILMFLSPVVYPSNLVPGMWRFWFRLNPLAQVIDGFRWSILGRGQAPDWVTGLSVGLVLALLWGGAHFFRRTERSIVDLL